MRIVCWFQIKSLFFATLLFLVFVLLLLTLVNKGRLSGDFKIDKVLRFEFSLGCVLLRRRSSLLVQCLFSTFLACLETAWGIDKATIKHILLLLKLIFQIVVLINQVESVGGERILGYEIRLGFWIGWSHFWANCNKTVLRWHTLCAFIFWCLGHLSTKNVLFLVLRNRQSVHGRIWIL